MRHPPRLAGRARRALKRPVFTVVERTWLGVFHVVGMLMRPGIERVRFSGTDSVLVIATHPDDEVIGCGRAICGHVAAGERVMVVAITDGRRSRALGLGADEMAARRAAEFEGAMAELGAEPRQLRLREGEWADGDIEQPLRDLLAELRPSIVYGPSVVDDHAEHRRVARALARALAGPVYASGSVLVRAYQVYVPLTPVLANECVVEDALLAKGRGRAVARYDSQAAAFGRGHRLAVQAGALWRAGRPLEAFWSMQAGIYSETMEGAPSAAYRGLRERPFGDGFAWLAALRARRRLAAASQRRSTT